MERVKGQRTGSQFSRNRERDCGRDLEDSTREIAPLVKAEDAILIDTSHLSIPEVLDKLLSYIKDEEND